jgi:hypothetical protein
MLDVKGLLTNLTSNLRTNSDVQMEWMNGSELLCSWDGCELCEDECMCANVNGTRVQCQCE